MKATTKTYYTIDHGDGYWIREATSQVLNSIGGDKEYIEFATREIAQEFAKLVLHKHAELTPWVSGGSFLRARDRDQAYEEIGGFPPASSSEGRFVGEPEIRTGEWGQLILHRNVETRICRDVETVKTVVVDGEEFTRKTTEKKWSEWYPANAEKTSISIYENTRVEVN